MDERTRTKTHILVSYGVFKKEFRRLTLKTTPFRLRCFKVSTHVFFDQIIQNYLTCCLEISISNFLHFEEKSHKFSMCNGDWFFCSLPLVFHQSFTENIPCFLFLSENLLRYQIFRSSILIFLKIGDCFVIMNAKAKWIFFSNESI